MGPIFRIGFWEILRDIFFPERCLSCSKGLQGRRTVSFCSACHEDIRIIREPYCTVCGKPFIKSAGGNHLCGYCIKKSWNFSRARAAVYYEGPIAEAVRIFKYNGKMYGLDTFTALIPGNTLKSISQESDLIVPVPVHPKRLRKRGFNQALVLARKFFPESRNKIDPHVLERCQWTMSQAGLSGAERRGNVRNAFRVLQREKIKNKKILLVDDVFTTGATVNECARILKKNQAAEIEVFTFARSVFRN
ncbi:MAG: ComF family protein [Deltaproteobacteria bacterium]|jgi:ComF family protein|nr:ComF family protein [Deltaproteobacteria bacterium]